MPAWSCQTTNYFHSEVWTKYCDWSLIKSYGCFYRWRQLCS